MRRFLCGLFGLVLLITCAPAASARGVYGRGNALGFEKPVRLHIVAESDDERAQALKLIVRDEVRACAQTLIAQADSAAEAYEALVVNLCAIRAAAYRAARAAGFEGDIRVSVGTQMFPARLYGDVLMEAGEYHALRVEIGEARGRNWWCVLYPSLCLYGEPEEPESGEIHFYSSILNLLRAWFGGGNGE